MKEGIQNTETTMQAAATPRKQKREGTPQQKKLENLVDAGRRIVVKAPPTRKRAEDTDEDVEQLFNEEKKRFDAQFRLKSVGDFRGILSFTIEFYRALKRYFLFFERYPPGTQLKFTTTNGAEFVYTLETVRAAEALFIRSIRNFYHYVRLRGAKSASTEDGLKNFSGQFRLLMTPNGPFLNWIRTENFDDQAILAQAGAGSFWQFVLGATNKVLENRGKNQVENANGLLTVSGKGVAQLFDTLLYIAAEVNDVKLKEEGYRQLIRPTRAMSETFGAVRNPFDVVVTLKGGKVTRKVITQQEGKNETLFQIMHRDSADYGKKNINASGDGLIDPKPRFDQRTFNLYWFKKIVSLSTIPLRSGAELGDQLANAILAEDERGAALQEQLRIEFEVIKAYNNALTERREANRKAQEKAAKGPTLELVNTEDEE